MRIVLLAILLCSCATPQRPPLPAPECSGGVCIFRVHYAEARVICGAVMGVRADGCWDPDIKAGWESAPMQISSDVCLVSTDPGRCRKELFGED